MKTPLQELIDSVGYMAQGLDADELYDYFMEKATQMLDKEKEVIQRAYKQGVVDEYGDTIDSDTITEAEGYYNRIFNGKGE